MEQILELLEEDNDRDEDQEPAAEVNGIIFLPPPDGRITDEDSNNENDIHLRRSLSQK